MHTKQFLHTGSFLFLLLVLSGATCTETKISTEIDTEEKISASSGNFDGNLSAGDQFGSSVTAIGDLEGDGVIDLAVGAPFDDDGGPDRGAVWVLFLDDDGRVDTEQKISSDKGDFDGDLDTGDQFGHAVTSIGDLNNDGTLDIAVGAPMDDDGGTDRGAVWILFLETDGTVSQFQKISSDEGNFDGNVNNGDQFGNAVASIGDLDNDGVPDLAVGAPGDDDGGTEAGAVWILFMNSDGTVKADRKISADEDSFDNDLEANDHFGSAVAGIGDLDNDGVLDIAVGANQDDLGGTDRGAVWILFLDNDGTVRDRKKIAQDNVDFEGTLADGDRFGSSIANLGDINEDGVTEIAVGAKQADDGGSNRGVIWVLFMQSSGKVELETRISDTQGKFDGTLDDNDQFGSSLATLNDLNQDGFVDFAAGAPLGDDGATDQGAVWVLFTQQREIESDIEFNLLAPNKDL